MLRTFRVGRPSPAMIIALIALFVALGGSGYAAVRINGKNIKNKSISGKKLKNRTITGKKVKRNTLTGTEIRESRLGRVPNAAHADDATNASNAAAVRNGAVTASKLGRLVNRQVSLSVPATSGFSSNAPCQSGERLTSGGVRILGATASTVTLQSSGPSNVAPGPDVPTNGGAYTAWRGAGYNNSAATRTVIVFALCLER
jgi:hypothetical protein